MSEVTGKEEMQSVFIYSVWAKNAMVVLRHFPICLTSKSLVFSPSFEQKSQAGLEIKLSHSLTQEDLAVYFQIKKPISINQQYSKGILQQNKEEIPDP
jgi:hypothetical protein